jgi:hypothetical protein
VLLRRIKDTNVVRGRGFSVYWAVGDETIGKKGAA